MSKDNKIQKAGLIQNTAGQTIAFVDWSDGSNTMGEANNTHMQQLLARAEREGKLTPATKLAQGHTPGPWRVNENGNSPMKQITIEQDDLEVTVATCGFAQNRIAQANARLIAAAPDLLAACKALLCKREGAFNQASAAIAKAQTVQAPSVPPSSASRSKP